MPINTGDNDTSQLLEEISKLKLSGGSGAGFKYAKSAINCQIPANIETKILDSSIDSSREILIINNTPESEINLFWDDGINKTQLPDKLNGGTRYADYSDGGLKLLILSNITSSIDIYVRSTKIINYQVGNVIELPEIEQPWYSWVYEYYTHIKPFKIPLKPIFISIADWDNTSMPLIELPVSIENGYEHNNKRIIGNAESLPIQWQGFSVNKEYIFYGNNEFGEVTLYFYDDISITQDANRWLINLYT